MDRFVYNPPLARGLVILKDSAGVPFQSMLIVGWNERNDAGVAQLVEQRTCNAKVEGSIPFTGTNGFKDLGRSGWVGLFTGVTPGLRFSQTRPIMDMHGLLGVVVILGCVFAAIAAAVLFFRDMKNSKRAEQRRQQLVSRLRPK